MCGRSPPAVVLERAAVGAGVQWSGPLHPFCLEIATNHSSSGMDDNEKLTEYQEQWWTEVRRLLIDNHGKSWEDAYKIVRSVQDDLKERNVGDMVYHDQPEYVAETLGKWNVADLPGIPVFPAPKFGIKTSKVVERPFWDNPPDENNPVLKVMVVEFISGNVYYSLFREKPGYNGRLGGHTETRRAKPVEGYIAMEETDMEMMVTEFICYQTLCPGWNEEKPQPKDEWDSQDVICDGNLGGMADFRKSMTAD